VYVDPFPPVAAVAVICAGDVPEQIVCAVPEIVLLAIGLLIFTTTAALVSLEHTPEEAILLNQVVCDKIPGA
jgi:hypothetical protein